MAPRDNARTHQLKPKGKNLTDSYAELKQGTIGKSELTITGGMQAEFSLSLCRMLQRGIKLWEGAGTRWLLNVLPTSRIHDSGILIRLTRHSI